MAFFVLNDPTVTKGRFDNLNSPEMPFLYAYWNIFF